MQPHWVCGSCLSLVPAAFQLPLPPEKASGPPGSSAWHTVISQMSSGLNGVVTQWWCADVSPMLRPHSPGQSPLPRLQRVTAKPSCRQRWKQAPCGQSWQQIPLEAAGISPCHWQPAHPHHGQQDNAGVRSTCDTPPNPASKRGL